MVVLLPSLWTIGAVITFYATCKAACWVYLTFFKPINLEKYRKTQSWAVVTGATDGIGLAFAQVLAEHGFNILLVSRNKDKLEDIKDRISATTKVQVDYVVSNALDTSEGNIKAVVDKLTSRDVAILVNNVGIGLEGRKMMHTYDVEKIENAIKANCLYPTLLSKEMIPVLLRHQGPKLVINLSSVVALIMCPFSSIYSATKAYNRQFSLAMSAEYHQFEMDVLCVEPGFVESSMTKMKPSLVCCTARECAESALRKVGDVEVIPHWKHMLIYLMTIWYRLLPSMWAPPIVYQLVRKFRSSTGQLNHD